MTNPNEWEQIDDGSFNGVKKYIRATDDDCGTVQVRYDGFDVPLILDSNKAAQNEDFDRKSEMWHAAKIPATVMYEWLHKHGVNAWKPDHMPAVKKLLNSSDYRYLKVKNIII